jgi:DNA-binding NarL/FixJ family response regulator
VTPIRVLIADDHAPIRSGVAAVLADAGLDVCGQASDGPGALEAALRERPDVCLLDVHMPGGGIRAAAEIASALPDTPIVMLTVSAEDVDLLAALRAGAAGYVLKNGDPQSIPKAVRSAFAGHGVITGELLPRVIGELRSRRTVTTNIPGLNLELTHRERDVLELLRAGKSTSEIAYGLSISDVTVRRHISELVRKAGVHDRKELLSLLKDRSDD